MIGIVTVLYNSASVLEDFFISLEQQTYKDFCLYIIDNASSDRSVEVAHEKAGRVSFRCYFIENKQNCGVAKGNNQGIKQAIVDGCDYVLLANNDIVLQQDTIEKLLLGMSSTHATMVVPKIYYWDSPLKIWMAGGGFKWLRFTTFHRGIDEEDSGQYSEVCQMKYAPTCFMLIESNVFSRIGFMDEHYFVYYDDSDFIWRSTILGYEKLFYIPDSKLWHKVSSSTGGLATDFTIYYMARNHIYFALKYCRGIHFIIFICSQIVYFFLRYVFIGGKKKYKIAMKAYKDGWKLYMNNSNYK